MLHHPAGRKSSAIVPDARGAGRRRRGSNHRRPRRARRDAPSAPRSVSTAPRIAVRVLHAGVLDGGAADLSGGRRHERRGIAQGARRPALPVHRVRRDPCRRAGRRRDRGRAMTTRMFGQPIPRVEDPRLLTGRGRYTDDFEHGAAQAAFVRSDFAHARIRGIDVSAASALPGVLGVFTHADLEGDFVEPLPLLIPNDGLTAPRTQRALALDEVCYAGETVAMVVARDRYVAEDAASMVMVDYEPLPVVADLAA